MSHGRIKDIDENALETQLSYLERTFQQLRGGTPQFIGGSSITYYQSQTAATWDFTGTLPDPGSVGEGGKLFLITAVADTMDVFWGNCLNSLYVDSSTNKYDGLAFLTDNAANNAPFTTDYTSAPNDTLIPNQKQWFCQITGNSSRTCWIKFFVLGIDTATVTVTALN